jgi:hypothetical protein
MSDNITDSHSDGGSYCRAYRRPHCYTFPCSILNADSNANSIAHCATDNRGANHDANYRADIGANERAHNGPFGYADCRSYCCPDGGTYFIANSIADDNSNRRTNCCSYLSSYIRPDGESYSSSYACSHC